MTTTPPTPPPDPASDVSVILDSCAPEDARVVFTALLAAFPSDRAPEPAEVPDTTPTVWAATFDVSRTLDLPGAAALSEPVTLTAQGGYRAVDRLGEVLAEAFEVVVAGTAPGDQEQEVRLRLANR